MRTTTVGTRPDLDVVSLRFVWVFLGAPQLDAVLAGLPLLVSKLGRNATNATRNRVVWTSLEAGPTFLSAEIAGSLLFGGDEPRIEIQALTKSGRRFRYSSMRGIPKHTVRASNAPSAILHL